MSKGWKIAGWVLTGLGALIGLGSSFIGKKENEAYIDKQIEDRESEYIDKQIDARLAEKNI